MSRRSRGSQAWQVRASALANNTRNLIRSIVEHLQVEPNPEKPLIALSVGKFVYKRHDSESEYVFVKLLFNNNFIIIGVSNLLLFLPSLDNYDQLILHDLYD